MGLLSSRRGVARAVWPLPHHLLVCVEKFTSPDLTSPSRTWPQAREPKKEARRFINDTVRNDFHRKFLYRYIK